MVLLARGWGGSFSFSWIISTKLDAILVLKEAVIKAKVKEQRKELEDLKAKLDAIQGAFKSGKGKRGPYKKKKWHQSQAAKDKISDARKELFRKRHLAEQAEKKAKEQKPKEEPSKGF